MSISDDIKKYLAWAGEAGSAISGAFSAGKITQAVYDSLKSKLDDIQDNINDLEAGGNIIEEGEEVAAVVADAGELVAEGAVVGVGIAALG